MEAEPNGNNEAPRTRRESGVCVGTKFLPNGQPRSYPGNTIISLIAHDSEEADTLRACVETVAPAIGQFFSFLPSASWHMTVIELLCDEVRATEFWSRFLPLDAPLQLADEVFSRAVGAVKAPASFDMRFRCLSSTTGALGLLLDPADSDTAASLASYRERISEVCGVRFPEHDRYQFHITLAYEIERPTAAEQLQVSEALARADGQLRGQIFRIGSPALMLFEDMTAFKSTSWARQGSPRG